MISHAGSWAAPGRHDSNSPESRRRPSLPRSGLPLPRSSKQSRTARGRSAAALSIPFQTLPHAFPEHTNAKIQTLSYSLNPNNNYPSNGQPVLTGYTASNTVQVTVTDLSIIGKLIDTGIQAGANRVQGLTFGLQNDMPSRQQALKMATVQAKSNADAMASGLGMTTAAVLSITEGSAVSPTPLALTPTAVSATTPVETGVVNVQATVTLQISLSQ